MLDLREYNYEGKGEFLKKCLGKMEFRCRVYEDLVYNKESDLDNLVRTMYTMDAIKCIIKGNVDLNDDYFYFEDRETIVSQSRKEYLKDIEDYGAEILNDIVDIINLDFEEEQIENVDDLINYLDDYMIV